MIDRRISLGFQVQVLGFIHVDRSPHQSRIEGLWLMMTDRRIDFEHMLCQSRTLHFVVCFPAEDVTFCCLFSSRGRLENTQQNVTWTSKP